MVASVEVLITGDESKIGAATVNAVANAATTLGLKVVTTSRFRGGSDWLTLWGVGEESRNRARHHQIAQGGRALLWDLGYIKAGKEPGISYVRMSVDYNHPWRMFDQTQPIPTRFDALGVELYEDCDPRGPVLVIGLGPKSREHLKLYNWEIKQLESARKRFPDREILYRPKPRQQVDTHVPWKFSTLGTIKEALHGASLVVCRHSNVAVDACLAGVPVECSDGAAFWLYKNNAQPDVDARLDFLRRLAWWQYRTDEMVDAWKFLNQVCA